MISSVICFVVWFYMFTILVRIVLSWFPLNPDGFMATIGGLLYMLTDPVLQPLRRVIPPVRLGNVALDLSAIIAILAIQLILIPIFC